MEVHREGENEEGAGEQAVRHLRVVERVVEHRVACGVRADSLRRMSGAQLLDVS